MASGKQLAVLLFTDIVGSVALQSRLGTEAYTRYITRHDAIFKDCLSYVQGASILNETGDGFLVKFGAASDAVETALRLQCLLREEVCEGEKMVLRIGLHMGEVSEMEEQITGDTRAVGMAINLCARIMDLAADGQILLTRGVFDEARQYTREHPKIEGIDEEALPPLQWPAHGRYIFKGTDEPMEMYEVGALGWAPLTPPEDSAKAQRAVSADEEATLGWRPGAGLPIPRHEKWVIVKKLGQGGFGEVWLAENDDTKDQRVFKFCFDPEKLRSFKRELTLFRLLRDALGKRDDIAALYDVSVESPPFYLESEYVPTGNMGHWADSKGGIRSIDLSIRVDLMARISRALAAAHSVGIIHKDIKPSNILIHEAHGKPYPRVADFGIGTLSDSSNLLDHDITGAGFTESIIIESDGSGGSAGTQLYMAPEYLVGAPSSVRGDVFSLGVMLYQMVAGDLTKPMGTGWERDIEDPLLCEDIGRCVDIDPERRFEDANQLAEQLESLDERRDSKQREREAAEYKAQLQRQADKRRRLLALGGVALLGMLGVMGALYKGLHEQRQAMAEQMQLKEEQMQLKDQAKVMASQADYALANEHLKQGHANMGVAHLARALRSDPNNDAANQRLVATLTYNNFPRRLYPPLSLGQIRFEEQVLPADLTWDGRHAAGVTANGGVEIFATASGESLFGVLIERSSDDVNELRFNEDSDRLFVKRKRSYQLIDVANGSVVADVDMRKERYGLSHELSMDGRYWIAEHFTEAQIHVHELYGDKKWLLADPKGASGNIVHFRASPDGRYLVAFWEALNKGNLSVCDLHLEQPEWKRIHEGYRWTGNSPDPVSDIDYANQNVAFGNANGEIYVLDLVTGETVHTFVTPRDFILGLRFSPGDGYFASGHFSQVARVWNLRTGELASAPLPHQGAVGGLDFSDDGSRLLTASLDGQVRLWDPVTGAQLSQPMPHTSQVLNAWFDDTEKQALTLTLGGDASVWDLTNTPSYDAPIPFDGRVFAVSRDHQRVVMRLPTREIRQFNVDGTLHEHQPKIRPNNFRFRDFRGDDFVISWMRNDEKENAKENVISLLKPDGVNEDAIIPSPGPYTVVDYDAITGNFLGAVTTLNGQPTSNTLELRNFSEPDSVKLKLEHESVVTAARLAPGDRYAVSSVRDQAFAWDLEENPPLPKKLGMSMVPTAIDIAEGVPKVMVGTITGVAQLWDIGTQQPLGGVLRHDGPILLMDMNAEATTAITLSFPVALGLVVGEFRAWNLSDSTPITPPIPVATPLGFGYSSRPDFKDGFVSLSKDGTHAIVCLGSDVTRIDLHPQEGVTIPQLADLAEGVAGFHIDETTGRPMPLSQDDRSARLAKSSPTDPVWKPWADWVVQNAGNRTISPSSDLTQEAYLEHLLGRVDSLSIKRALSLSPNHPAALAALGEAAMKGEAGEAGNENQSRAAFYISSALTQIEKQGIARQKGLEEAYGDIVEVSLKLGAVAEQAKDLDAARKHYATALRAAIDGCETNPDLQEGQLALALSYTFNSHLVEGAKRQAYLDAAILTLALLKAEGVPIVDRLSSATSQRWPNLSEGTPIIAPGSLWQYSQEPPVDDTWKIASFDASDWTKDPGPLGYGDDFAKTVVEGRPQVLYLRHTFTLKTATPAKPWLMKILYDDGAAVYLDGELIHEENIRNGKVPRTISSRDEGKYFDREISLPRLEAGQHTIAISVHQDKPSSSDLMIDLAAFLDAETVTSKLKEVDSSTIGRIVEQLGDQVPSSWAEAWHFYHAPVADAASPLAVSPSAFYRRALVQESRHRFKDAEAAAHVVIRMSADDTDTQWVDKAEAIVERLRLVN